MRKKNSPNLKLLGLFIIICTSSLFPGKINAQEYSTKIENIDVLDSEDIFSKNLATVRVAELTIKSEVKLVDNDTISKETILPPAIEYKQLGFVTEDLENAFPDVVNTNKEGDKSINYNALVAVMFKIIKEQEERIEKLELQQQEQSEK